MKTIKIYEVIIEKEVEDVIKVKEVLKLIDGFYNKILKGDFTPEQLLFIAHLIEKELKKRING